MLSALSLFYFRTLVEAEHILTRAPSWSKARLESRRQSSDVSPVGSRFYRLQANYFNSLSVTKRVTEETRLVTSYTHNQNRGGTVTGPIFVGYTFGYT
jgi:hypothetical protein